MINSTDMYKKFKERNPGTDITYPLFKYILTSYNKQVVDVLMRGETFNIGSKIGKLKISKFPRNFKRKTVDWGETNKLRKQGIKKMVYYTDDYYYGYYWQKKSCSVKNKSVYKFHPAGGKNGPKKRLINYLKADEMNRLTFSQ